MPIKSLVKKLDRTLLLLASLVLLALIVAVTTGGWETASSGFSRAGHLFSTVWVRLLLGFTLGGLVRVLIPSAVITKWLGHASGFRGILIGSYIGIIMPGGPYVTLPVIASIYSAGAGVGPVIALLTGRSLLGIQMLVVWQIPFLGVELPLARYIACLLVPPLVGLAGAAVFRIVTRLTVRFGAGALETAPAGEGTRSAPDSEDGPEETVTDS